MSAPPRDGPPAPQPLPPRIVVVAYLLAVVCAAVPPAVVGAVFAGVVLVNRGRRGAGAGVILLAAICTALGLTVLLPEPLITLRGRIRARTAHLSYDAP